MVDYQFHNHPEFCFGKIKLLQERFKINNEHYCKTVFKLPFSQIFNIQVTSFGFNSFIKFLRSDDLYCYYELKLGAHQSNIATKKKKCTSSLPANHSDLNLRASISMSNKQSFMVQYICSQDTKRKSASRCLTTVTSMLH